MRPEYVKVPLPSGDIYANLKSQIRGRNLHTVCEEARCPNVAECWGNGTATFMVMGKNCSRGCRFCSVTHGRMEPLDPHEPDKIADTVKAMGLDYVVITSVDRDDLPDQGARHFAKVIEKVKDLGVKVEALIPDFRGDKDLIRIILDTEPDVLDHNVET
ncbi:MAG TPA: lipoyl synthase, partial [Thermoplasmataceae archaeon]|nr:lipoyl synthase [Thermoplasmataceae archaeon]